MENKTNPMRTKFIKVAVSDELPKKDGFYFVYNGGHHAVFYSTLLGFNSCMIGNNNSAKITHWLKEVPDHEAELVEKTYQIDFNGNVLTSIKVVDNKIEILGAINGYGNGINVSDIKIEEIPNPKSEE